MGLVKEDKGIRLMTSADEAPAVESSREHIHKWRQAVLARWPVLRELIMEEEWFKNPRTKGEGQRGLKAFLQKHVAEKK
jgi:hypothetical protein